MEDKRLGARSGGQETFRPLPWHVLQETEVRALSNVCLTISHTDVNSWSPDGAHITASNATNNEGYVFIAAVISRNTWTSEISLVGHENTVEVAVRTRTRSLFSILSNTFRHTTPTSSYEIPLKPSQPITSVLWLRLVQTTGPYPCGKRKRHAR